MLVKVRVLQSDIEKGVKQNNKTCPIARAVKREFNNKSEVNVGTSFLTIYNEGEETKINLPSIAKEFIQNFDKSVAVEPFDFVVALN